MNSFLCLFSYCSAQEYKDALLSVNKPSQRDKYDLHSFIHISVHHFHATWLRQSSAIFILDGSRTAFTLWGDKSKPSINPALGQSDACLSVPCIAWKKWQTFSKQSSVLWIIIHNIIKWCSFSCIISSTSNVRQILLVPLVTEHYI